MKKRIALFFIFFLLPFFAVDSYQIIENDFVTIASKTLGAKDGVIFRGVCLDKESMLIYPKDMPSGMAVTKYTFDVSEWLKAPESMKSAAPTRFEWMQYGVSREEAKKKGFPYAVGFVQFEKGWEGVVFLSAITKYGLRGPVGMSQGVFNIVRAADGTEKVVSRFSNKSLFKNWPKGVKGTKSAALVKSVNVNPENPDITYGDLKKMINMLQ